MASIVSIQKKIEQELKDISSGGHAYNKAILAVGYAGYFGLWQIVKSDIDNIYTNISALLTLISLFGYIWWEIYKMFLEASYFMNLKEVRDSNLLDIERRYNELQVGKKAKFKIYYKLWPWVFPFTVVTAYAGVIVLGIELIKGIWTGIKL